MIEKALRDKIENLIARAPGSQTWPLRRWYTEIAEGTTNHYFRFDPKATELLRGGELARRAINRR